MRQEKELRPDDPEAIKSALMEKSKEWLVNELLFQNDRVTPLLDDMKELRQKCYDLEMALGPGYEWSYEGGVRQLKHDKKSPQRRERIYNCKTSTRKNQSTISRIIDY